MIKSIKELLSDIVILKKELDELRPFDNFQLQNLRQWFRIGFIQNSNGIEGNTMTLTEVKVLLEDGVTVGGKSVKELQETLNHNEVMENLSDFFDISSCDISEKLLFDMHKILLHKTLDDKYLGVYRSIQVKISGVDDILPEPFRIQGLMEDYFSSTYITPRSIEDVARIHREFVKIHPFVDGNGRIARLLMNIGVVSLGYFPVTIPVVLRQEYIDSLKGNNFQQRYHFFVRQLVENHKDYCRFLKN